MSRQSSRAIFEGTSSHSGRTDILTPLQERKLPLRSDNSIARFLPQYRDALLEDTIPFWTRHSVDRADGGFLTFLDRDGSVYGTDKPVWLQGRMVWVFSRLYNSVEKRREWLDLAHHGLAFIRRHCVDSDGRFFFLVTRDGKPLRKRRYLFSEIFTCMGMAEYALAAEDQTCAEEASQLFDLIVRYWQTPGLLEPKVNPEVRPTRSHTMSMIMLNLSQVMRRSSDAPRYREMADFCISDIFRYFFRPELRALVELVGPDGELLDSPEGRVVLPGHAIETAWFIMEEGRSRDDNELARRGLEILEWSLERGWDEQYGGILYYTDLFDKPCVQYEWDMKLWWPHTEALYATLLAWHLTGDEKWAAWFRKIHDYSFSRFHDPEHGEWYGYLHRDGSVSHRLKGNLWKGPYHLSRCQLYCWKLLEEIASS